MRHRGRQLALASSPTWGGRRDGAGRKPAPGRRRVPHRRRAPHDRHCPVHVTLCLRCGARTFFVPYVRRSPECPERDFGSSTSACSRITSICFSRETAPSRSAVASRALRFASRRRSIARSAAGKVWADRYHVRALATPREVRHALVYVLQNVRKHLPGGRGLDPWSSAAWFTGWRTTIAAPSGRSPVVAPQTARIRGLAPTWAPGFSMRRHAGARPSDADSRPL
jgi:REP-associated tyrosine transposase